MDGNARMAIEQVVTKLHVPPNPNPKTSEEPILDIFWKEFDDFQNKTGPYGYRPGRFLAPDALYGNSYVWLVFTLYLTLMSLVLLSAKLLPKG